MSVATDFGLYPTPGRVAGQRVAAGQVFDLGTPVQAGGVTRFRRSLWLAVPAAARDATVLHLAASALAMRFEPLTLEVGTDDRQWFGEVRTEHDNQTVQLVLNWPATVIRLLDPGPKQRGMAFDLYRADGDRRADAPTQDGRTGSALNPPWVGSPMVVVMRQAVLSIGRDERVVSAKSSTTAPAAASGPLMAMVMAPTLAPTLAAPSGAAASAVAQGAIQQEAPGLKAGLSALAHQASHVVPALVLRGAPTSPRATLVMVARGDAPETLLWQALLPGEQGTVTLPQQPLATEWAPALEQVRKRLAAEAPRSEAPLLLRLDIESDAPARVTLLQATLALEAEFEVLPAELRIDFDGAGAQAKALPLDLPAGLPLQGLTLTGRVGGGTDTNADVGALPADQRCGLLLGAADRVLVHAVLTAPQRVAGLSLAWLPLSDAVTLTLRLLADAGNAPSVAALAEWSLVAATPATGWLALRGDALDLQAQHLWLELTLRDGSGLWLTDAAEPLPTQGHVEQRAGPSARHQPLGQQPRLAWLPAPSATALQQPRRVGLFVADVLLAAQLDERFTLDCPGALLSAVSAQGLQARSGSAARLTLVSARARIRLA